MLSTAYLLVYLIIFYQTLSQKAILVSSSIGYYNMRQMSNIMMVYHNLKQNGFKDQDILLIVSQVHPCCQKNPLFGSLSFYDGDYTNIFKNVQIDYFQSQITLQLFSDLLLGYYSKYTLNKRKINLDQNEPVFMYLTGHGGDYYFKIREKQAIINQQVQNIFDINFIKNELKKTALISDTCSAITPYQNVVTPNFIAIGSSSKNQKSTSHGFDSLLNQAKSDDFSYYFSQILNDRASQGKLKKVQDWSFQDLQKYMDISKLKVNSKLISNNISKNEKISKFIKKQELKLQIKRYKQSNHGNLQFN